MSQNEWQLFTEDFPCQKSLYDMLLSDGTVFNDAGVI